MQANADFYLQQANLAKQSMIECQGLIKTAHAESDLKERELRKMQVMLDAKDKVAIEVQ